MNFIAHSTSNRYFVKVFKVGLNAITLKNSSLLTSLPIRNMAVDLSSKIVFVTNNVPKCSIEYLKEQGLIVKMNTKDGKIDKNVLYENVKGAHGIYCLLFHKIDKELLDAAGEQLQVISTMSVGYDHIDVEECKRRSIKVGYTPDVLSAMTAELCIALLLAVMRRLCEGVEAVKTGKWGTWTPMWMCGKRLRGATVGIVGMGRIGKITAEGLKGLGVARILYTNRSSTLGPEYDHLHAKKMDLQELLASSDVVLVLCSVNEETKGMFNRQAFKAMKKSAVFVNCGRGDLVVQEDLCWAIENKEIWGAGLDVTTPEPLPPTHPLLFYPNVVVTPHIGSAVVETREEMSMMTAKNIVAALRNEPMPAALN